MGGPAKLISAFENALEPSKKKRKKGGGGGRKERGKKSHFFLKLCCLFCLFLKNPWRRRN